MTVHREHSLQKSFAYIEGQWPAIKYLAFGFYYAWIFLCYKSSVLLPEASSPETLNTQFTMYLASTCALAVMLMAAAALSKQVERLLKRPAFVLGMAALAGASTLAVAWCAPYGSADGRFIVTCALTGVGTAFVCLRFGVVYSTLSVHEALMYTSGAFILAALSYYVVIGVPSVIGLALMTLLPLTAALLTMTMDSDQIAQGGLPEDEIMHETDLPRRFFPRLVASIAVFSLATGLMSGRVLFLGITTFSIPPSMGVFVTLIMCTVLFAIGGLSARSENLDKLYYPIIVLACFGIMIGPMLGMGEAIQAVFVGAVYNLFILFIWCLLAHIANRTDMGAVRVFGWGRGASALGTTIGYGAAGYMLMRPELGEGVFLTVSVVMVFVLLVVSLILLNAGSIDDMLEKTHKDTDESAAVGFFGTSPAPVPDEPHEGLWTRACNSLAERFGLTNRERDVLFLLSKGRTIEFVAQDLHISFNTAKTHIRHVYNKTGVHTRQELLDLIEKERDSL